MDRSISRIDGAITAAILRLLVASWCGLSIGGAVSSSNAQTMQYFGGPVIGQVKVVPVFWNSSVNTQVKSNATQFFQDAVNSPWLDLLSAYSTNFSGGTQQTIVRGTALSGVTLVPSKCATSSPCTMADSDIQAELAAQIRASNLPNPDSNTAYMIFMPPNVTWTDASGHTSGSQFCAYNSTAASAGGPPIVYGTIIDTFTGTGAQNCGPNANALQNETALASMILANAITDPDFGIASSIADPVAWFSTTVGQVGSACSNQDFTITVSARTWSVNQVFNKLTNSCDSIAAPSVTSISPAVGPAIGGTSVTITGSNFTIGSTVQFGGNHGQNVIFINSTQLAVFSPPGCGTVDVTVTNDVATSATSAADQFTYRPSSHDFNADCHSDIAWRDPAGNVLLMFGATITNPSNSFVANVPSQWAIVGQRDFNGDGHADLLWHDTSGNVAIWEMNGSIISNGNSSFVGNVATNWSIVGTGDFNGDGKADILWQDMSGNVAIWEMNGTAVLNLNSSFVANVAGQWSIKGTGDFNGDGKADILWQDTSGNVAIWEMNGTTVLNQSNSYVSTVPGQWSIKGTGDFNGDGKADILWQDTSGNVAIWEMNGTAVLNQNSSFVANVAGQWSIGLTGDFNGDANTDILWQDTSGNVAIWEMNGTSILNANSPFVVNVPSQWTIQSVNAE
jgi:IPT/TIG domain/FG-GAP-like repeat